MTNDNVGALVDEVYGAGCTLQAGELGEGIVQAVVLHPAGVPLMIITARSEVLAFNAVAAALEVLKAG